MNHSSQSRVLTLQGLDIEERSSVSQMRESLIGGVFRFREAPFLRNRYSRGIPDDFLKYKGGTTLKASLAMARGAFLIILNSALF